MIIRGAQLPIRPNYDLIISHSHSCIYFLHESSVVEKPLRHQGTSNTDIQKYRKRTDSSLGGADHNEEEGPKSGKNCGNRIRPKVTQWVASMGEKGIGKLFLIFSIHFCIDISQSHIEFFASLLQYPILCVCVICVLLVCVHSFHD